MRCILPILILHLTGCYDYLKETQAMRGLVRRADAACDADRTKCSDYVKCSLAATQAAEKIHLAQEVFTRDRRYAAGESVDPPYSGQVQELRDEAEKAEKEAIKVCSEKGIR